MHNPSIQRINHSYDRVTFPSSAEKGLQLLHFDDDRLELITPCHTHQASELRETFPDAKTIYACDFPLEDIEAEERTSEGFWDAKHRVMNIDHHAEDPEMHAPVTSTYFARRQVATSGAIGRADQVVINHLDTDSVLSAGILLGILSPDSLFVQAAHAADHSCDEHPVADLLQSLAQRRDRALSFRNLGLLLLGEELDPLAQQAVSKRRERRSLTREAIESGNAVLQEGPVSVVHTTDEVRGDMLLPHFPQAKVILTFSDLQIDKTWTARVKLGTAAPKGLSLFDLKISEFDSGFRGRWNAGSNKRAGGTKLDWQDYAKYLQDRLEQQIQ